MHPLWLLLLVIALMAAAGLAGGLLVAHRSRQRAIQPRTQGHPEAFTRQQVELLIPHLADPHPHPLPIHFDHELLNTSAGSMLIESEPAPPNNHHEVELRSGLRIRVNPITGRWEAGY